jgi:ACR3 family arsenite transporter
MSAQCETTAKKAAGAAMPFFERYLSLWVALCIITGILLGRFMPGLFESLGSMEVARVNLPVAVLIWLMILPMLLKIDFHSLSDVKRHGVDFHTQPVCRLAPARPTGWLHCRIDTAGGSTLHGNGVRME